MTHLLRAQAAQLSGDRATARRIFEAMLASPDTEQLGLRGLFLEAKREGEPEAARQFADRAARLNPRLAWPLEAQFEMQCKAADWAAAAETVAVAKRNGHLERDVADRRRALMLAAQAQALEESNADKALAMATEAHTLAPDLIPSAAVAGRILASRGQTAKAAKIIQRTWSQSPHPDLAAAYAYARIGDSTHDRLDRIKQLALLKPYDVESGVAWATAAIEAREFRVARHALQPFLKEKLTRRVARLMARIETEEKGDAGRAREWIARAATAARDPVWTADAMILDAWAPISPVTGTLDAVESSPMLRRRDIVVAATARACVGVSEALQAAAAAYAKATSEKTKAQLLVNGAAVVLKDNCANCAVADPLARAGALVAKCPLPGPGEKAHPDVLGRMRAADYAFLNALLTSLLASGEYDETAHRLVLQFIISSAQLDENRKGKPRK